MPEKVQVSKRRVNKSVSEPLNEEKVDVMVEDAKPIFYGVATTNLVVDSGSIEKGEQVDILEDKGDEWLTNKGLVSKLFMLLRKIQ